MTDKIMIIDGNSIINRAFYGVPLLSNKNGEFTNAVYGFLNIFFKLFDEEKPKYAAVAFDLKKPTFRHLKFEAYKGTRKGMPDELAVQMPVLKEVLKKMRIETFEAEGFEADDIIGTIAKKACEEGVEPVIVSGDRDLLQIASENIKVRIPKTKGGKTEVEDYFANDVLAAYGVTPKEFIEVKALMGDSSDNVPGVPGIGEKTAVKIIQQYKTVENAVLHAAEIKPKRASENLEKYREQAFLSKELVTIVVDADIDFDLKKTEIGDIFNSDFYDVLKRLEFKSMLQRFDLNGVNKIKTEKVVYRFIDNISDAKEYFMNVNPWGECAYSIISENGRVFGISFSSDDDRGTFIAVGNGISDEDLFSLSKGFFEGENAKIAHDAKKDIHILKKYGVRLENLIFDTMIAGYILDSTRDKYECGDIAEEFLDESYMSEEEILGKGKSRKSILSLPENEFIDFVCRGADISFRAKDIMLEKLKENGQEELYFDIELPLVFVLADMEMTGMKADKNGLIAYRDELQSEIDELTKDIYWLAGEEFNINSPKQLGSILFEKLGLKGGKKTRTGWSTAADILEKLKGKDEIVDKVLEYRTYSKLKSTYADGLLNVLDEDTGKIYSTFNQAVTATGRISSTEPNLQNIPIKIELGHRLRKIFVPENDEFVFIDADYSQIELRVLAHLADDETLIRAFKEGQDIHRLTASQVFNVPFDDVSSFQRSSAKAVNFGIVYGIGAFSLSQDLGISKKEADLYIDGYFKKYPNVKKYMEKTVDDAKKNGFAKTVFNRMRNIPELSSNNFVQRSFGERVAMNMPVQGTAADIIKIAMVRVYRRMKKERLKSKIILQVHDELLIEAERSEVEAVRRILKDEMENAVNLKVPLEIDIHEGVNWYEAK